jgi:hypothetical protein
MNWARRSLARLVVLVALAGCDSFSSGGYSSQSSGAPVVRCLSDPARDNQSQSRPLIFLFCAESP